MFAPVAVFVAMGEERIAEKLLGMPTWAMVRTPLFGIAQEHMPVRAEEMACRSDGAGVADASHQASIRVGDCPESGGIRPGRSASAFGGGRMEEGESRE